MTSPAPRPPGLVLRLAAKDMRHEWLLTACIVLALAAILSPLMIVLGLKEGVLHHMTQTLIENPVNREIRPQTTEETPGAWIDDVRARDDVAFVIPGILRGASIVRVVSPKTGETLAPDLLPTGPGDPLLLENGAPSPGDDEIVVSTPLAMALGYEDDPQALTGERLRLIATRSSDRRSEEVSLDVVVAGVLGLRGDGLERVYAPLQLVLDIENYKESYAVPARGWSGGRRTPYASYDGAIVIALKALSPVERARLAVGTGFSRVDDFSKEAFETHFGFQPPEGAMLLRLSATNRTVQTSSFNQLANVLRGSDAVALPYIAPIEMTLEDGRRLSVSGYSVNADVAARFNLPESPWGAVEETAPFAGLARLAAPEGVEVAERTQVRIDVGESALDLPLRDAGAPAPGTAAIAPAAFVAMLRTGADRPLRYDPAADDLVMERGGFRGFRLYAKTISDVPTIVGDLRREGRPTLSRVQEIVDLRVFGARLDDVFRLVAGVGAIGGAAALIASLFAAVERKRRDISVMRLLGLSPGDVFRFPLYQGAIVAFLASGVAIGLFFAASLTLNSAFEGALDGSPAVRLEPPLLAMVVSIVVIFAVLSAVAAAWKATRIEPADALRVE